MNAKSEKKEEKQYEKAIRMGEKRNPKEKKERKAKE